MNRNILKKYAPQARREFIQAVTDRASYFGLTKKKTEPVTVEGDVAVITGRAFPKKVGEQRKQLEQRVARQGFDQVMEAMAYTWFNRLVAIRFMELHGYLEHGYRVLSHPAGSNTPELLEHADSVDLPGLDAQQVIDLKLAGDKDAELYRMLLIAQCNALHKAMPFLFERIDDETELLLPDNLLHSDSLIRTLVNQIPEEDWQEVEVIGWLYQFYISEKKDEVIGKVVKSEDIPAATQLFTPNWIVKYLVQNSLGRQWMATYPNSSLKNEMEFYIEPAEQTPEVEEQLKAITPDKLDPEALTLLDPACGSGHILVEAYDLLKAIYVERGFAKKDIPRLILEKNLYGLEIDDRAAQLASLALMMKARADDRRIFAQGIQPHVLSIQESKGLDAKEICEALNAPLEGDGSRGDITQADVAHLIELFEHGKTFGSLINPSPSLAAQLPAISDRTKRVAAKGGLIETGYARLFLVLLQQAQVLSTTFDAVITNPPFMGGRFMNRPLKTFASQKHPDVKHDIFAMFIVRCKQLTRRSGQVGLVTPFVWMFISSFEKLREYIAGNLTINSLVQLEYNAFEPACVPVCAFTLMHLPIESFDGTYIKLTEFRGHQNQAPKTLEAIRNPNCPWRFQSSTNEFSRIPGMPIAFWLGGNVKALFEENPSLGEVAQPRKGNSTSDNNRFLRHWYEVNHQTVGIGLEEYDPWYRWIPYNKGGGFRRWYGLNNIVIDWLNEGAEIRAIPTAVIANESLFFKPGLTWSTVTTSHFSVRLFDAGFIFDNGGCCVFSSPHIRLYLLALLNSKVFEHVLEKINPTLNYQSGDVAKFPTRIDEGVKTRVEKIAAECVAISKLDWDASESSWDFSRLPMLAEESRKTVEESLGNWSVTCEHQFTRLADLETQNNEIFASTYGLSNEIVTKCDEAQVVLRHPDRQEDIQRLISYAIGCMMGRYSLDKPGLIYAQSSNEGFDSSQYETFAADEDGIVPITEFEWFDDDAASRVEQFIATAWPEEHIEENLKFITESIGQKKSESAREAIRRYLSSGFYKHHLSLYKKRPIYWNFSSGKQRAFQCLVYLHRYNAGTLARMRTEYVIPLSGKIDARIEQLAGDIAAASSTSHAKKLTKERDILIKHSEELQKFDEKLKHYADQRIELDLDDGVKVNYGKFGDLLAEVKAVTGQKAE